MAEIVVQVMISELKENRQWRVFLSWRIPGRFHGGSSIWTTVGKRRDRKEVERPRREQRAR